jgi:hypothetical protein
MKTTHKPAFAFLPALVLGVLLLGLTARAAELDVDANGNAIGQPAVATAQNNVALTNLPLRTNENLSFGAVAESSASAAGKEDQAADLAKRLNNPISDLISVPFQSNWDFNIGLADGTRYTLNVQPVVPISISKDWNLIIRTILPVISQTDVFGNSGTQSGLGNTTQSFFLSPKEPWNGVVWGLGPVGYYPTNTDSLLGPDKWGLGPTFVALVQPGQWTIGVLANQIWSVGGSHNDQNISSTFLQPFIVYTLKSHTSFSLNTESTYDWQNSQWTVPINLAVQQVFKVGKQPMALEIGGRYYAAAPSGGPDWGIRANLTFLFPTGKHEAPKPPSSK